jgi:hypothetical protein
MQQGRPAYGRLGVLTPSAGGRTALPPLIFDRVEFIKQAHAIRSIRNDVMHFNPDPPGNSELLALRRFARFVMELSRFLVPATQVQTA